ncbi:PREDICTED: uncharacterized protein LOC108371217 [Rhagoletis zephyria]|uniref:uncharacterized protein LOC108371217 n=1 Tax=Rhagoletis zephyria TaxID=28612 RepID=UPI0008119504|nr:PREDICTED: uncharacterized protein LOC108371217 [Rhagoletis zephyria]
MQDLRGNQQLFGGALVLLPGDFRQTLPVIPPSTPADEINACLKSSPLWRYVQKLTLHMNMRVQLHNNRFEDRFSKQFAMNQDDTVNYPVEFLNSMEPPGMPPHCLNLKVGSSIILLPNLNAPKLLNGTRLAVKKFMANLVEATILTGKAKGEIVLIPRIPLIKTDMTFEFKRLQFPVRLAFALSVNKAPGQTLQIQGRFTIERQGLLSGITLSSDYLKRQ